jgi:hypothetical protein
MSPAALIAEAPALPLHEAGKYVAGAYLVLFVLVLIYVAIMALRLSRIERDLGELLDVSENPLQAPAEQESELEPAYPLTGHPPLREAER